jgi:hypothetical protein
MVETGFLDANPKNEFCNLTATYLSFPGGCKKATQKSVESENKDLEILRIAINFCIFRGMQLCAAAPASDEVSVVD